MTAISGRRCVESSTSSGPLGSLEKMLLGTSRWASMTCFLTWNELVTPAGRLLFRLSPSMPSTAENGSGLWPTATVGDSKASGAAGYSTESGRHSGTTLTDAIVRGLWPTPNVPNGGRTLHHAEIRGRTAIDPRTGKKVQIGLEAAVKLWPTPHGMSKDGKSNGPSGNELGGAVNRSLMVPTPTSRDWKSGKASAATRERNSRPLSEHVGGSLNPTWVEWLMGYPTGWTALKHSETQSSRKSRKKSSAQSTR